MILKKTIIKTTIMLMTLFSLAVSQTLSGRLNKDTLLDAASSPWQITGDVTVPDGVVLTIEAGCVLHFAQGTHLYVENTGRLSAEGTPDSRILMTAMPNTTEHWSGLRFTSTLSDNLLHNVDMLDGDNSNYIILIDQSRVTLDGCTWNSTTKTIIEVNHPSALIKNCIIPNVDHVEPIHGLYLENEEYLILRSNTFGMTTGYNDVIDFTDCKLPGPILQVYDNLFLGGGDDGLDLDGTDTYVEGNVFTNFHRKPDGEGTSNGIATGLRNGKTSNIIVVRNLFLNNDHGVLLKEDCFMQGANNTFVNNVEADINFSEWPVRTVAPGKGAALDGNIFWGAPLPFGNQIAQPGNPDPTIVVNRSIIAAAVHNLGYGNIEADPQFIDPNADFHLLPTSPAIGAGPNGLDIGAYVPPGASISGEPADTTMQNEAVLTVGGPGIVSYQYAVNDANADWSQERSIALQPTIELTGLETGSTYTIYVRGKNAAGVWQSGPAYTVSKTWFVRNPSSVNSREGESSAVADLSVYPNPFNSSARISFTLPKESNITTQIYDVLGRLKTTVFSGAMNTGRQQLTLNAENLASGIYFIRLQGDSFKLEKRIFLVR
jgi:hypothetical protein